MKETVKTSRTAGYLEKIFRALNAKYFNGELEEPIITIQSTPRAYGHVTVAKAWQRGDTTRHELNIGAGTLARPIENVVATTLHECVHLWNLQNGIQDCSRGGQYHNKKFKAAAEARDLKISYNPRIGWSITEPTDALCEFILEQGWQDINMNRIECAYTSRGTGAGNAVGGAGSPGKGANSHSIKYVCPCCHNSVRATKAVNIKCADCDEIMLPQ
ncbi:SprT-like domain-containing protein [Gemmiger sp.]